MEPSGNAPTPIFGETSQNTAPENVESASNRICHSTCALLVPLVYGLVHGSDSKWTWTAFQAWLLFFLGRRPDSQRLVASLILWSMVAFVLWAILFALSNQTMILLYLSLYFLMNACLLFVFHFKALCRRISDEAYQTIWLMDFCILLYGHFRISWIISLYYLCEYLILL